MPADFDLLGLQSDGHSKWTTLAEQHRENLRLWDVSDDETRAAYTRYIRDSRGLDAHSRELGAAPPMGFAEFVARSQLDTDELTPWQDAVLNLELDEMEQDFDDFVAAQPDGINSDDGATE